MLKDLDRQVCQELGASVVQELGVKAAFQQIAKKNADADMKVALKDDLKVPFKQPFIWSEANRMKARKDRDFVDFRGKIGDPKHMKQDDSQDVVQSKQVAIAASAKTDDSQDVVQSKKD